MNRTQYKQQQLFSAVNRNATVWYSYNTIVAVYDMMTDHLYLTSEKFSQTTTKHLNTIKKNTCATYEEVLNQITLEDLADSVFRA